MTSDISAAEAAAYVAELVDSQLLVADSQPQVTGPPPAHGMATVLAAGAATGGIGDELRGALERLAAIDAGGIGASPEAYRRLAADLGGLPAAPDPQRFVQVDLVKPAARTTLSGRVTADILRGAQILHALARPGGDGALAGFREQFARRYETREMPLAQVLDEETGIGFPAPGQARTDGAPLLAGLPLRAGTGRAESWTRRDAFLCRRLTTALAAGLDEISIDAAEADDLRGGDDLPLPEAFEVVAAIVARVAGCGADGCVPGADRLGQRAFGRAAAGPLLSRRRRPERAGPRPPAGRGARPARLRFRRGRAPAAGPDREHPEPARAA